ncbi:MAG: hypothetical protein EOO07_00750 [Chitinophagaceae bacterium]|nr:MAG: hypothetical protein EOO07_00750 [Chitinophagaceae bacterium]
MKNILYTFIAILLLSLCGGRAFAQKTPDTLVISTKNGQIILVSDSLANFAPMQNDVLIKRALIQALNSPAEANNLKAKMRTPKDSLYTKVIKKRLFRLTEEFGAGLIRDKVSPSVAIGLEFSPQKQDYYRKKNGMYSFISLSVHSTSTFKEVDNKYRTDRNTFLQFTLGNRMNPESGYKSVTEFSSGVGYLIQRDGNYFERNTFKIFINFGLPKSSIIITPEYYFDKNDGFLGLTVKLVNLAKYF